MNNWQPINTAPKDREILLAYKDKRIRTGWWDNIFKIFVNPNSGLKESLVIQPIAWQELPVFYGVIAE